MLLVSLSCVYVPFLSTDCNILDHRDLVKVLFAFPLYLEHTLSIQINKYLLTTIYALTSV